MTCMSFNHRIGEMLRTRRLDCGLPQDAVAQMVSIPAASLSRIENGDGLCDPDNARLPQAWVQPAPARWTNHDTPCL